MEALFKKGMLTDMNDPSPVFTRIGLNTGEMVVGNMGTSNKMNYTIMGNAVNLAARLEGVNKQYGTWILATGDTIGETGGRILTRKLDQVRVVGINEPVRLHEVIETTGAATAEQRETAALFDAALAIFEKRDWAAAQEGFEKVQALAPGDGPAQMYLERCQTYRQKPPQQDWDGVFNLSQK
jgi:adenylate cyclase